MSLFEKVRRLWMWGSLDYPGDRESLHVGDDEWRKLVRDYGSKVFVADDPFWAGQQWIRRVFKVEMEWRLWRWMTAGALVGIWAALR